MSREGGKTSMTIQWKSFKVIEIIIQLFLSVQEKRTLHTKVHVVNQV